MLTTNKYSTTKKSSPSIRPNSRLQWTTAALVGLILISGVLIYVRQADNEATKQAATALKPATSKGDTPTEAAKEAAIETSSDKGQTAAAAPTTSTDAPKAPYGAFVSSHKIGLNDGEISTCITSIGVKCGISFTKDGVVKSLPDKTTSGDGSASWSWTPSSIGLTAGIWTINVTATNNGKTASTADARNLEVSP